MSAGPEKKELKAQWKTDAEVPALSISDVAKHKSKSDNWIVIHGHGEAHPTVSKQENSLIRGSIQCDRICERPVGFPVVPRTCRAVADDHSSPGGADALLEVAGTDATSAYEDVGHSEDAR